MNIKKTLLYSTAGLITAIGLVACGSSSSIEETPSIAELPPPPPPAADPQGDCPTVGNIEPVEVSAGQCTCLLYTSPSPRDRQKSRMPSSA